MTAKNLFFSTILPLWHLETSGAILLGPSFVCCFYFVVFILLFKDCTNAGGVCHTWIDGYYAESIICVVLGILWLRWKGQQTRSLQDLPESVWRYQ